VARDQYHVLAAGFGLFFVLRPPIASIPWTGAPFFASDLRLSLTDIGLVAGGIPLAAATTALLALRRVRISPLGVSRRVPPRPPRARRLIPLLAGLAELTVFTVIGTPQGSGSQTLAYLPGFLLVMAGLIVAGPWFSVTLRRGFTVQGALVSCGELARAPALGRCPGGAQAAVVPADRAGLVNSLPSDVWAAAAVPAQGLRRLPVLAVIISTNGSTAAIEEARTTLELAYPEASPPQTISEYRADAQQNLGQWQQLADVVILVSLPIAGCALAASVAGSLTDRKRPFSLLRMAGAPLGMLRQVVALESAVPLVVIAVVSAAAGFLAAALFLHAQLDYSLVAPPPDYYGIALAGLVLSMVIIAATFPLLTRVTGPEAARNE
jgi:hypothetical protein